MIEFMLAVVLRATLVILIKGRRAAFFLFIIG
jgi:hypothetical protein